MPKPRRNEAKQDFLGRCLAERREAGESEADALAACTADWNQGRMARLAELRDRNTAMLAAEVAMSGEQAPEGGDGPSRFAILAYTGKEVDWGWLGRFIIDLKGLKLRKEKAPSFYFHDPHEVVGTIDGARTDANGFYVLGQFSQVTGRAREVLGLAREGFPWQASIGVEGRKLLRVEKGRTHMVNGRTVEGPIDVWLESEVFEVSFVPFGADDDTAAVALSADANLSQEEDEMPEKKDLMTPAAPAPGDGRLEAPAQEAELAAVRREAAETARRDTAELYQRGLQLNLSAAQVTAVVGQGLPLDTATARLFELAGQANPPLAGARLETGADERDKFRLAARHGVLLRLGLGVDKPAPGHEEFRGLTTYELARLCLERAGVDTRGLSRNQVASKVLALSSGPMSTSDFAAVFKDAVHKTLLKAYAETPSTWRPWVNVVPATDFKEIHGIALSEAPDLVLTLEGEEYRTGTLRDKQESYSVGKYGRMVPLTYEMIVNDDLRAFARMPRLLGQAARRKESDVVYGLLLSDTLRLKEDNKLLFHGDHRNLASGAALGPVSPDTLKAMQTAMRRQKGIQGAKLNLALKYIIVPAIQETDADIVLRSATLPKENMPAGTLNPWSTKGITPIVEPRLDDVSEKAWFGAADPAQVDTVEVAFLDGSEQPYLEEIEEARNDSLFWKVRHVFGAGVMDFRGLQKNPGE